jgi:hypothetical protein
MDRHDDSPPVAGWASSPDVLGGGSGLAGRLERWAAEARVEDAARQRISERWLRQQAEEGASLLGVLSDLAERGTAVAVRTRAGRQHRGAVLAVGEDFVAVGGTLVALAAISSIRTLGGSAVGDRPVRTRLRLAEVLAQLAAERERALIVPLDGEDAVAGSVRSVGVDVVVVRLDGPEPATAYVPIAAVGEVVLDPG